MADIVSTDPEVYAPPPRMTRGLGFLGWLRWVWRQLTSMRTALFLLFLLALAAVPGSLLPQRGTDPVAVSDYLRKHQTLGPFFNRISGFDVFAAPWFAAIYVLLLISLIGCVLPRSRQHLKAMRARPPAAPRNLDRLPVSRSFEVDEPPEAALRSAYDALRGKRFRVDTGDGWVAAEKGFLRETGNLVFHLALVVLLLGVGTGAAWGYKGTRIMVEGTGFADTLTQYDGFSAGRFARGTELPPFTLRLKDFAATYQTSGDQRGAARSFAAYLDVTDEPGAKAHAETIHVNDPLHVDGTKVFLIGHGYAPRFTVKDGQGRTVWSGPIVALPQDPSNLASTGVLKASEARPTQLGFVVDLFPTAASLSNGMLVSVVPGGAQPRGEPRRLDRRPRTRRTAVGLSPRHGEDEAGRACPARRRRHLGAAQQRRLDHLRRGVRVGQPPGEPRPRQGHRAGRRHRRDPRSAHVAAGAPTTGLGQGVSRIRRAYGGRSRRPLAHRERWGGARRGRVGAPPGR